MTDVDGLVECLLSTGLPVYRYESLKQTSAYLVWSEERSGDGLSGDNVRLEHTLVCTVDLYTKDTLAAWEREVQRALERYGVANRLNSVQYEPDTKYTHYEWVVEVVWTL